MFKTKLFLDESGKASLASSDDFILTGVILQQRYKSIVEGYFNFIKSKYGVNVNAPYHSYHIYEHPYHKLHNSDLKKLSVDLADFLSVIPVDIKIIRVNKAIFRRALGIKSDNDFTGSPKRVSMKEFPYLITFSYLLGWFSDFIKDGNVIGEIVADSRRAADKHLVEALDKTKSPECILDAAVKDVLVRKCTAIRFATKYYLSGGLELTDYISYTSFFKVRKKLGNVKDIGLEKVWKVIKNKLSDNDIHTLTKEEIQKYFKIDKDGVHKYLK